MTAKPYLIAGETKSKASNINKNILTLDELATLEVLKQLAIRHKFGLVCTYAIVLTVSYLMPFVWSIW